MTKMVKYILTILVCVFFMSCSSTMYYTHSYPVRHHTIIPYTTYNYYINKKYVVKRRNYFKSVYYLRRNYRNYSLRNQRRR
jgi:hypothetical protein